MPGLRRKKLKSFALEVDTADLLRIARATFNKAVGIVGFGKGALWFPSQLGSLLSYKGFSYCLISYRFEHSSNVSSPLILGASESIYSGSMQYTPMLDNPMYPNYYYIGLQGNSIDNTYLEVPLSLQGFHSEGNGGMIIDSGTTYTHLPETFYEKILTTLQEIIPYSRSHEYEKPSIEDVGIGPAAIFGNFQQQNFQVFYDLEKMRIGF
ncbi:aspartic proteinase nepenthesin-2-like [Cryptomeria japonica]|uniref:aspartic proteinase nepenthesin-2-like n=1 Tax=Cryptomeria japonica TaxID=3369 RepID=UPI0027DA85FB|nr:aspartic proteinase nepenthesin-2-like [Cryptomeria japonica]